MVRLATGIAWIALLGIALALPCGAQGTPVVDTHGDSVTIRLVDVDLRAAVQALSSYLDKPVVFSGALGGRVTLETPRPVPRRQVQRLLQEMLASQNVDLVSDSASNIYRLRTREATASPVGIGVPPRAGDAYGARPMGGQAAELFAIHLRHAKAVDVAATVNALYGRSSALREIGERPGGTLSRDLAQMQVRPDATSPGMVAGAGIAAGQPASFAGDVTIIPDARGNTLLVRASRQDFALIQAAVAELDVRPLQVLIEVLIAEVRRDRALNFGVDISLPRTPMRGTESTVEASSAGTSVGDFVVKVMNLGSTHVDATMRAAASRGDATILSRPVLLAANNEHAEINVGSQRPFVQLSRVLPTDNSSRDQVIQYKDVGTKLQITPTISADGYVMLQITQEINAATAEQQFNAPVISTRSVDTRLLVKDGQTIVLGGLTDEQKEVTQSGIPILSSIPLVGGFFGRASRNRSETELFLFVTARVIRSDEEAQGATTGYETRARKVAP
jgi:general secretion pathway protein D